jgi:hypothetical protein
MTASGGSHPLNAAGNIIPSIGKAKPGGGQMDSAGMTELKSGKSGKMRPCRFYASGKGSSRLAFIVDLLLFTPWEQENSGPI